MRGRWMPPIHSVGKNSPSWKGLRILRLPYHFYQSERRAHWALKHRYVTLPLKCVLLEPKWSKITLFDTLENVIDLCFWFENLRDFPSNVRNWFVSFEGTNAAPMAAMQHRIKTHPNLRSVTKSSLYNTTIPHQSKLNVSNISAATDPMLTKLKR